MKLIIFFIICIFGFNSCGISQNKITTNDVLIFDIYFADHFENDTIDFSVNGKVLLTNCNLNSSPYDLTRINIKIYKNNKINYAVINDDASNIAIEIKDINSFKLINKNHNVINTNLISTKEGRYIIYRGDDYGKIKLVQTTVQPGFD